MKRPVLKKQKLVAFLQGSLEGYSGKFLRKVLEANLCRINGRIERFGSALVRPGDVVQLAPNWTSILTPKWTFDILYEDDSLKIINKPSGWVCDPKNALTTFGPNQFLVHRLDKETTGALILAKSPEVRDQLMQLFEKREISKKYLALVDGIPKMEAGRRHSLLCKKGSYEGQTIWGSGERGLSAKTYWKKIVEGKNASLLLCEPLTGRTHQIRVHMAEMGHPILVDRQYAKTFRCQLFVRRVMLHAYQLNFSFQGKQIHAKAPLFFDMRDLLLEVGVKMGHLRQLFGENEENDRWDDCHKDKDAEEIKEPSHFLHQAGK